MFLLWAIAQERLSVPFKHIDGRSSEKFKSALFMGTCQSILSAFSAFCYIQFRRKPGESLSRGLGLEPPESETAANQPLMNGAAKSLTNGDAKLYTNGVAHRDKHRHGHRHRHHPDKSSTRYSRKELLLRYLQCSVFITSAAPFGFAALSYISYPAMVLGKSCKLVPVMIMNVLLYRRKFAPHKYLVVFMVTTGITLFMFFGSEKKGGRGSDSSSSRLDSPSP